MSIVVTAVAAVMAGALVGVLADLTAHRLEVDDEHDRRAAHRRLLDELDRHR